MDFDHVDEVEHPSKTLIGLAVVVLVAKDADQVRMIHLNEFFTFVVPVLQPFNLDDRVQGNCRPAAVLGPRPHDHWKRILVVDRQRLARQLHARAGRHQLHRLETLQMWQVAGDSLMLGTRRKLKVLGQQIQHATALIAGVVARG